MATSPESATLTADPATSAWKAILELVGWGGPRPPRFPMVAMELGLSPKQMGVIWRLAPGDARPMREIARTLFCDASYVTDLVDKLEDRGLIERRSEPRDRRVKLIALTPEGEAIRERALEMLYEPPTEIASLSPAEQAQLAELLERATAGAGEIPSEA